jgi:murein DD-endopeptidase MepM/ murein hydrolase activator NlpD
VRLTAVLLASSLASSFAAPLTAQSLALPPIPDSSGWGVHVLAVARDSSGGVWVGTYGDGIYRLPDGATTWEHLVADTSGRSISFDFINGFAFGPNGEIWYGTVGNGWGLSRDGGRTWRNWELKQLGPEWQYLAPGGIVTRGDTTVIGTADGIQITTDDGVAWTAIGDTVGPRAKGPADTALALLDNEYVLRIGRVHGRWYAVTLRGVAWLRSGANGWRRVPGPTVAPADRGIALAGTGLVGTHCGLQRRGHVRPCLPATAPAAGAPRRPLTTWFARPIAPTDQPYIDQTYRYGSTMGGVFQQHQGVEFNNPDGTPVHAIEAGDVVYAGRAEEGANTVAIRHDTTVAGPGGERLRIYSVYYHNTRLGVHVGDRVRRGDVIAWVGNTGRATNDHLHLEVHASPTDSVPAIVDSLNRYPPYTTNPELWIRPLPGTGIVAGQVLDADGRPVPQARVYGIVKPRPTETPFSYAETYGEHNHPHPLYHENFAVGDVPAGSYTLGAEIGGKKVYRRVTVKPGMMTWVVLKP